MISHYSLIEDGDEKCAAQNRCDFKLIDPKKGSATDYIAKYVSKNIDGEGLDKGVYGEDPITAAQRVDAWSSCWCIRQFQQIGGASVSVWRELRRLKKNLVLIPLLRKPDKQQMKAVGMIMLMQWVVYLLSVKIDLYALHTITL